MVLTDTRNNVDIGTFPSYPVMTVDTCIRYLRGRIVGMDDPSWSDKGDNVIIDGKRYRHEDLAITDQLVTGDDIYKILKRAADFHDADTYAQTVYLSRYFVYPFSAPAPDNPELEGQLRILWHVARDPFRALLDNAGLTPEQCSDRFSISDETMEDWLSEDVPVPPDVRLMIAEATGRLKLRNLT